MNGGRAMSSAVCRRRTAMTSGGRPFQTRAAATPKTGGMFSFEATLCRVSRR